MHVSPQLISFINHSPHLEQKLRNAGISMSNVADEIKYWFDLSPEALRAEYRKQTDLQAVDCLMITRSHTHWSDGRFIDDKTHHATAECKAYPFAIAEFKPPVKVRVSLDSPADFKAAFKPLLHINLADYDRVDFHGKENYRVPIRMSTTSDRDREYSATLYILDERCGEDDLHGMTVQIVDSQGQPLDRYMDGARLSVTFCHQTVFFTPDPRGAYTGSAKRCSGAYPKLPDPIPADPKEEPGMSTEFHSLVKKAAEMLVNTDLTVRDILSELEIKDQPRFYTEFRSEFQRTPTDYRRQERAIAAANARSERAETVGEVPWDFTVSVTPTQASMYTAGHTQIHGLGAAQSIPITVNEHYAFTVEILTHAGTCPYEGIKDLMRGEHRDQLNDQVLEILEPYFHGRLDIAYGMNDLPTMPYAGSPIHHPATQMLRRNS